MSLKEQAKPPLAAPKPRARTRRLAEMLGRFSDARAVIETACRAMENGEDYTVEMSALRSGLRMLDQVYDELDVTIAALSPHRPRKNASRSGP